MAEYNSFDICEAFMTYGMLWHVGGLTKRCRAKHKSIDQQLFNLKARLPTAGDPANLTENGLEIYIALVRRWEGDKYADEEELCYTAGHELVDPGP